MSRMSEINVKEHMRSAVKQMTPAFADALWQQPVERATGDEWYLKKEGKSASKRGKLVRFLASAAACLAICICSVGMIDHRTDATVYLDVNPSVELKINHRDKVLAANADNADGAVILEDMDLEDTDLDVALNAIIGSMVKHGYLNEAQKMILLSVDSKDEKRAEQLRQQISTELHADLASLLGSGSVLDQSMAATDEMKQLAQQYEITPGKALLLQRLTKENPNLDYAKLAKLPINELIGYLKQSGVDVKKYVHCTGDDLDDELEDLFGEDDDDDADDLEDNDDAKDLHDDPNDDDASDPDDDDADDAWDDDDNADDDENDSDDDGDNDDDDLGEDDANDSDDDPDDDDVNDPDDDANDSDNDQDDDDVNDSDDDMDDDDINVLHDVDDDDVNDSADDREDDDNDHAGAKKAVLNVRPTKTDIKKNVSANRNTDDPDEGNEDEPDEDEDEDDENEPDEDEDEDEDNENKPDED